MQVDFQEQTAVVTGGTAGIGRQIALDLAKSGAKVFIGGTNPERGKEVVSHFPEQITFIPVNVSDKESVETFVKAILASAGSVDILVNNAGITRDQLLMKMSADEWDAVLDTNLKSCFLLCHAFIRPMMKARKGRIINVSSVVGLMGNPGQTNYAASKAGMIGFTKSLAKEVASRGITVNCIAPGFIETNMTGALTEERKQQVLSAIPMGRMGKPE
ncbi:MAG: beta-ketoacyl-ACP reductase, partial [Chlamydiia bacterium]|nr:beta-ketoacyl-ACP reductase [Chlamydiia bacterium]